MYCCVYQYIIGKIKVSQSIFQETKPIYQVEVPIVREILNQSVEIGKAVFKIEVQLPMNVLKTLNDSQTQYY